MARKRTKDKKRKSGRPKGSRNAEAAVVTVEPSRCRACGSTRRGGYYGKVERPIPGVHDGRPYTHIIWRRCACLDCGQVRVDKAYENRPRP